MNNFPGIFKKVRDHWVGSKSSKELRKTKDLIQ